MSKRGFNLVGVSQYADNHTLADVTVASLYGCQPPTRLPQALAAPSVKSPVTNTWKKGFMFSSLGESQPLPEESPFLLLQKLQFSIYTIYTIFQWRELQLNHYKLNKGNGSEMRSGVWWVKSRAETVDYSRPSS